jgi:hypothetical protein
VSEGLKLNKETYSSLFKNAVEEACLIAEKALGRSLSRRVTIRMFGAGANCAEVAPQEFIDRAYIGDDIFYRLIDIMVVEVRGVDPVVFARVSDHKPAALAESWNGMGGPFKQLVAGKIVEV